MEYTSLLNTMRRKANIGLWGSVSLLAIAALFFIAAPVHFRALNSHTTLVLVLAVSVLTVLAIAAVLLVIRKQIPLLRQADSLDAKVQGYTAHVGRLYTTMLVVVLLQCVLAVLADQSAVLMMVIVSVLLLFLAFPNMYKVKADLGLTDPELQTLFPDYNPPQPTNEQ